MARKATEKQRICIVSFQWGNMILNEHFLVKTSDGVCLQMNTYCAFRKQAENFYLEIFVSTQVGGREEVGASILPNLATESLAETPL